MLGLTGGDGTWRETLDYDAWGKRRMLDGLSTPDNIDGTLDNKGYTGHEMLDGLDLVHMNGRIYDPRIARFVSADPIVQAPDNGQSWNRYSYVWNNPTNATDPTGFAVVPADEIQTTKQAVPFGADEFDAKPDRRSLVGNSYAGGLRRDNGASTNTAKFPGSANGREASGTATQPSAYDRFAPVGHAALAVAGGFPILGLVPDTIDALWTAGEFAAGKASWGELVLVGAAVAGTLAPGADQAIAVARAGHQAERAVEAAKGAATGAESAVNGLKLNKSLASQAQMGEAGTTMAGAGARVPFRDAARVAKEHGGNAADWVKKNSSSHTARDGATFEAHWVENVRTGQRVEFKTKFPGGVIEDGRSA